MSSPSLLTLVFFTITQCILIYGALAYRSPGETVPHRVEIATGGSANITCHMNLQMFDGQDSESLYFVEDDTGRKVPRDDIKIVSPTEIVYMLRNAPTQNRGYVCKSGTNAIDKTHVSVGTAPVDVNDFKCRGFDYTFMVCNFTIPQNTILTQYNLTYTAQSPYRMYLVQKNGTRVYRTIYSQNYLQVCQLELQHTQAICNLTLENNNYRSNYEFYNFTLTGHNVLDTNRQSFWINHYESVIPPRPEIQFEHITTDSVEMVWHMIKYSYYNSKGLQYEIRLRPEGFDWLNHSNYEIRNSKSEYKLKLRNLPYAFYQYTVSVRTKVRSDHDDGTMWSEMFEGTFKTQPCLPDKSPRTDTGSFYIDSTETYVRLYWEQLPVYQENGANFGYVVTQVKRNNAVINLNATQIDRISAIYPWDKNQNYEFTIKSRNDVGESLESSRIIVPALATKTKPLERRSPYWIRNVYHAPNRTYTLSWNAPLDLANLDDYTVFWCRSKRAIANECQDTVQFQHISKDTTKFSTEPYQQEHTLNLAVSANYRDFNTGMHWTACTADVESDLVKLELEITATSARTINVQWSLDRVCTSLLEGYNLTYCRVEDTVLKATNELATNCLDKSITIIVEKTAKKYLLDNLQPYSVYKIEMYMFSKLKKGKVSDAQLIKTKEEAPTPPRSLKFRNVTSNSAWISWLAPTQSNGYLRFFTIVQNSEHLIVNCSTASSASFCSNDTDTEMTFKLENLSSFTNYKVYIIADTIESSSPSNDIHFKTLIGIPSNPREMMPMDNNRTIMQWSRPAVPSGRVEFYEVAVVVWYKNQTQREHISGVVGSTACKVHIPPCINADYSVTLHVRAVNVAARGTEIDYNVFAAYNNNNNNNNSTDQIEGIGDEFNAPSFDVAKYVDNDELKCVGTVLTEDEQAAAIARYRDTKQYVQYRSVWENGTIYGCAAPTALSHVTTMALIAVLTSLGVMAAFYVARNKYIKMSDIQCKLPGELEVTSANYPTKGGDDIERINGNGSADDFHRSKESLYNNESHRLLSSSSIGNDSGYKFGNSIGMAGHARPCSIGMSSGYVGSVRSDENYSNTNTNDKTSTQPIVALSSASTDDAYMVMELKPQNLKNTATNAQPIKTIITSDSGGYVNPSIATAKPLLQLPSTNLPIIPSENGYIKPNNKLFAWQPPELCDHAAIHNFSSAITAGSNISGADGYIQPRMLQKPTIQQSNNGYTTLEALGKPIAMNAAGSTTSPLHTLPPISGYVTQKELSAYGQQHHMS